MRWIAIAVLLALAALAGCSDGGSSGTSTAEELAQRYWRALADEDWPEAWGLFSSQVKTVCSQDNFVKSREAFKEQAGDSYDVFWLGTFLTLSEGDWQARVSADKATLSLEGQDAALEAVREDGSWLVSESGEYRNCLAARP